MWFELLNFIIGIAFGFFHRGKEDRMGILKNGAILGIVLGILLVIVSMFLVQEGTSVGFPGIFGIFIEIIIFVIIFIAGTFIGDWLEGVTKK